MSNPRLPKKPIYRMFYDGKETRKIIEWLQKLDDGSGEINFDDPELQAALQMLSGRISNLETLTSQLPNMTTLINRVSAVESLGNENKESILDLMNSLLDVKDRIDNIDNQLSVVDFANILNRISYIENALSEIISLPEMTPITNEELAEILSS